MADIKSVQVFLLKMCKILKLSAFFAFSEGLLKISNAWWHKKIAALWLAWSGISTDADAKDYAKRPQQIEIVNEYIHAKNIDIYGNSGL